MRPVRLEDAHFLVNVRLVLQVVVDALLFTLGLPDHGCHKGEDREAEHHQNDDHVQHGAVIVVRDVTPWVDGNVHRAASNRYLVRILACHRSPVSGVVGTFSLRQVKLVPSNRVYDPIVFQTSLLHTSSQMLHPLKVS